MKRLIDVCVAGSGLVLLSPVFAVVAILIRLRDGSPVFFRQARLGLDEHRFELFKFRTMRLGSDDPTTDAERITRLGRWLRATSLDELPTLVNVITGDMSLVGPRPLPVRYGERYTPYQSRRHEVRPGITGLAQVSGRNSMSWEERFALDVEYVENKSIPLDTKILFRTVRSVLAREGISAEGHATMPEFKGPKSQ